MNHYHNHSLLNWLKLKLCVNSINSNRLWMCLSPIMNSTKETLSPLNISPHSIFFKIFCSRIKFPQAATQKLLDKQ